MAVTMTSSPFTLRCPLRRSTNPGPRAFSQRQVPPSYPVISVSYIYVQLIPESIACRLFVLTVLLETAVDLAVEGDLLVRLNSTTSGEKFGDLEQAQKKMPVYLALFALAQYVAIDRPF